jgi:hypothetical protein
MRYRDKGSGRELKPWMTYVGLAVLVVVTAVVVFVALAG